MLLFSNVQTVSLVSYPQYFFADKGYAPGGASDQLSFIRGHYLLGNNPKKAQSLEFTLVLPKKIIFQKNAFFCLTGAKFESWLNEKKIINNKVYFANEGAVLNFGKKLLGLRLYLTIQGGINEEKGNFIYPRRQIKPIEKTHFSFLKEADWLAEFGIIRVIKGPEYSYIKNDKDLFKSFWKVSHQSNNMGIRLQGSKIHASSYDITSSAVNDGTVQLSSKGLIILMRERQTIGGYPRILNVIKTDLDLLSQKSLNDGIRFKLISFDEALGLWEKKHTFLRKLFPI